jgi:hypothetical protein
VSEQHPTASDDGGHAAWISDTRAALTPIVPEPLLAFWPFAQSDPTAGDSGLAEQLVLVITPTTVRAYAQGPDGGLDTSSELAAWSRESLSVTVAREPGRVTLRLTTPAGEHVELQAAADAQVDTFVRLIEHPVEG